MNFRPELAAKVMAGDKTVTRRLVSTNPRSPWYQGGCSLKVGQDYAVCPGRGKNAIGRIRVTRVERMQLGVLSDDEARREGCADSADFHRVLDDINGPVPASALVWRIAFEVVTA